MVDAVGASGNQTQNVSGSQSNPYAELDSSEFVKLMVAELVNQDPFEPNDTAAVMEQLSSLMNIESQNKLQASLESMVNQQSIAQSSGLIGYEVTGLDGNNKTVTGVVQSIRVVEGEPQLVLTTGKTLGVDRVTDINIPQQEEQDVDYLWDTNGDDEVTYYDYEEWYSRWEENQGKDPAVNDDGMIETWQFNDGDFDGDGDIDITDLTLLQKVFGDIIDEHNNPSSGS
ncbi:hypothetical protein JD969_17105 [Planctomycetota bacterium]|nr:hypothetical protein JD969_17105 [Planctomycetota bacterium]